MKRILSVILILFFLPGCSGEHREMNRCMALRERLLMEGCAFTADVTADFGDKTFSFSLECTGDAEGALCFSVTAPKEIAGIGGNIQAGKGKLVYEETVLAFPMLAEGELSPVSAPWLLVSSLRGGYLASCGAWSEGICLTIHDSYEEDALQLEVWLDGKDMPIYAEIYWQGRRVLSMEIKAFRFV